MSSSLQEFSRKQLGIKSNKATNFLSPSSSVDNTQSLMKTETSTNEKLNINSEEDNQPSTSSNTILTKKPSSNSEINNETSSKTNINSFEANDTTNSNTDIQRTSKTNVRDRNTVKKKSSSNSEINSETTSKTNINSFEANDTTNSNTDIQRTSKTNVTDRNMVKKKSSSNSEINSETTSKTNINSFEANDTTNSNTNNQRTSKTNVTDRNAIKRKPSSNSEINNETTSKTNINSFEANDTTNSNTDNQRTSKTNVTDRNTVKKRSISRSARNSILKSGTNNIYTTNDTSPSNNNKKASFTNVSGNASKSDDQLNATVDHNKRFSRPSCEKDITKNKTSISDSIQTFESSTIGSSQNSDTSVNQTTRLLITSINNVSSQENANMPANNENNETNSQQLSAGDNMQAANNSSLLEDQPIRRDGGDSVEFYESVQPKHHFKGILLLLQQYYILWKKKWIFLYRSKWNYIIILLLANISFIIIIRTTLSESELQIKAFLPIQINEELFKGSTVVITYDISRDNYNYARTYQSILKNYNTHRKKNVDIYSELANLAKDDVITYYEKIKFSIDWGNKAVTTYFRDTLSGGVSLNILSNTVLKRWTTNKSILTYHHSLYNHEMDHCAVLFSHGHLLKTLWATINVVTGIVLLSNVITLPNVENLTGIKHLELMTGVPPPIYWASLYFWDVLVFIIIPFISVIVCILCDPNMHLFGIREYGVFLLMWCLFGCSGTLHAYLFTVGKRSLLTYRMVYLSVNTILVVSYYFIHGANISFFERLLNVLTPFCPILQACFRVTDFAFQNVFCKMCEDFESRLKSNCPILDSARLIDYYSPSNPYGIGEEIIIVSFDCVLYFAILFLIEYNVFLRNWHRSRKVLNKKKIPDIDLDTSVLFEKIEISLMKSDNGSTPPPRILVDGLTKIYTFRSAQIIKKVIAIRDLSFLIHSGECLGLLGITKSGKTTLFNMLTGWTLPTVGDVYIDKYSISKHRSQYLKHVGYCPQDVEVIRTLTGLEMIRLFALLRGLKKKYAQLEINKWIYTLDLNGLENIKCKYYSLGSKRKLFTVLALVGDPPVVYLDEPTVAVDAISKFSIWKALRNNRKLGQSIILSTKSASECEAACDRLAILESGRITCIGTVQKMKRKFEIHFTIKIKLRSYRQDDKMLRLKIDMLKAFDPACEVYDDPLTYILTYHIKDTSKQLSHLFKIMEVIKRRHKLIEDFTISRSSFDKMFTTYAQSSLFCSDY